ncbi:BT0820 family HAD-type phosphatase [Salinimicrobium sediminilitoris]|uniref:BT0820 family HAD-type phosphatase n=1 Tax=Salinimicrobium sediminilitoris TaxID=2876715 RepID=UPI001E2C1FD1|nr:hydrolase [Salinimicrobium sediminilitoris]MCC8358300.1 hydrolase [Salinimicrobium sediminilitoris]
MPNLLTIAVDFDGTLVENRYPKIGKPVLFAFETLKKLQQEGHQIILWTYRSGIKLTEAVEFCESKGIKFYAINKSYPEEQYEEQIMSRKILADIFIDDRNINGLPPWGEIYHKLANSSSKALEPRKKNNRLLEIFKKL